jgi:hypothetical protein
MKDEKEIREKKLIEEGTEESDRTKEKKMSHVRVTLDEAVVYVFLDLQM